ncbi:MAG: sulfatase-like hydrolase/transferase [Actinomycetota bacterium]|nr:sulfatase-like hydrolase/transferase [Actinomycetota bacterium]
MSSRNPARPNVLFVVADDLGSWALGCYGNTEAVTPTIDELASRGVRFDNFFCTSPVCSPARASLLSGQIPSQHGVHDWIAGAHVGARGEDFLAGRSTLYDLATRSGYRCGLSGKWHLGASDRPRDGFVHWFAHESGGGPYFGAPMLRGSEPLTVEGYLTDALAEDAMDFLSRESDESDDPFWLHLHFTAPHSPWVDAHPTELVEMFADCDFESCPQGPAHPWLLYHNGEVAGAVAEPRESLMGYFAAVTGLDRALGRVLGHLDELGLRESTLVFFVSDNGFNAGHHGIWGKGNGTYPQNMFDTSVRVPAIVSQPGRIRAGTSSEALISGYDLLPSFVELLDLPDDGRAAERPGRSFAHLIGADTGTGARDGAASGEPAPELVVVFDEYGPVRMIRTRDWKYVARNGSWPDELYDLGADPGETENLSGSPAHAQVRADLAAELDRWFSRWAEPDHDGWSLPVTGLGQLAPLDTLADETFRQLPPGP